MGYSCAISRARAIVRAFEFLDLVLFGNPHFDRPIRTTSTEPQEEEDEDNPDSEDINSESEIEIDESEEYPEEW